MGEDLRTRRVDGRIVLDLAWMQRPPVTAAGVSKIDGWTGRVRLGRIKPGMISQQN
jgi:hypothetical protein